MSSHQISRILSVLSLVVSLVTLVQCGSPQAGDETLQSEKGTVALKNFRELAATYSEATGVSIFDPDVRAVYLATMGRLSGDGSVEKVSPAMLLAATTLASAFCNQFIAKEISSAPEARRWLRGLDVSRATEGLTIEVRLETNELLAELFWNRSLTEIERSDLDEVMKSVLAARTNEQEGLFQTLLAQCVAVAGSLESLSL